MKASDLARPPMRNANLNSNSSGSTNSPLTPGPAKGLQPGGGRLAQGTAQANNTADQQQYDSFAIYDLFTSSVVALISFHLVKDYKAVALNYRTFISKPTAEQDSEDGDSKTSAVPHWLTNVNVYWASSGTLVVSTFSLSKPEIHCLDEVATEDEQNHLLGKCVRIAPNGILAKVASFDDPLDATTDDINQRFQRKRARIAQAEQGIERWKATVKRWLGWKGYSLPNLADWNSWVKIRISQWGHIATPSPVPNQARDILWPRALCFYYSDLTTESHIETSQGNTSSQADRALEWFETSDSSGFRDPIDLAQQWFLGKPERDRVTEARRRAKKAEEDATRIKEENHGLFPSSPLNARTGTYGDLQAVSGVYPTPPDGILPGTAVSSGDTPTVSGAATNIILAPGGSNPAINLSAPQEPTHAEGHQQPLTSPGFAAPFDHYHSGGGNDDLFEDMDEDGFDGNDVTDADFNFFDEPDGEDVDMLDAPNGGDSKPTPGKQPANENSVPLIPEPEIKEESSDLMDALDNALATASGQTETGDRDMKTEQHIKKKPAADAKQAAPVLMQPTVSLSQAINPVSKEPTPPLSPRFIEKALLPSPKNKLAPQTPHKQVPVHHRDSIFNPLSFNRKMSLSDSKYQGGRFSFPSEKVKMDDDKDQQAPRRPKSLRDLPLLTKLRYAIGVASTKGIPEVSSLAREDSDLSDTSSETSSLADEDMDEDISIGPISLPGGMIIPAKRKLPTEGNATPLSATSFGSFGGESQDSAALQVDEVALTALEPTSWDWSLVNVPPPTEVSASGSRYSIPSFSPILPSMPNTPTSQPDLSLEPLDERPLSGKDSIAVAQIVTDQIVPATLDILQECPRHGVEMESTPSPSESKWQAAIKHIFSKATECNVTALASVSDVFPDLPPQAKGQQRPPPRMPNEGPATLGQHLHQINPPFIRVRRADILWDLLPPAVPFWEPLGLSPCSSGKNVVGFCVYPHSGSLRPCVENFLLNVQLAYDNCRLGNHTRVETVPEYEGGLVPCQLSTLDSPRAAFKALRDTCIQLGNLLAAKHAQMRDKDSKIDAFVIYMVDPFEKPSSIWELCSAFWTLFQAYGQGPPGRPDQIQKPDLVLQLVPIKYVASFEAPVILDSSTYATLAREVYDRCPPSAPSEDKTPLSIYTAPAFQLEEPIPRSIPFKLNAEPPQDLLHENSYIHLGYAMSLDGTWITAAWTDICGKSQAVVSYNLGTRMFGEVAKEIWHTTIEILQSRRVTWRVCITKAGVMDREEMEAWVFLVSCPTQLNLFVTLLAVDTEPPLKFTPPMPPTNAANASTANPSSTTPVSTPQAGVSPEHGLTPAATPSADNAVDPTTDPEARLVDSTDETWGIILAHRLHNSNSTNEFRPALISGLLVKRGLTCIPITTPSGIPFTPDPERGPIIVTVNMLWMGAINPTRAATSPFPPTASAGDGISPGGAGPGPQERSYSSLTWTPTVQTRAAAENLMKEVLGQFRGLGLLARLKGMRGTRHGTVPWHVAAATRGVKGLGKCVPS